MRSTPAPWLVLERGEGAHVTDADGREYLDFLAGIAVNALGHAHPVFVDAVARQASAVAHVSNYFATRPQIALAERLCRLSGGSRVFFGNSGAEAIEAALKLARLTGRPRILALENSFHGRTTGSLALTGKPALRRDFEPLMPGIEHLDSEIASLERAIGPDVAALFLEPIKGEAGVVPLSDEYLRAARELTSRHGVLLVVDEIQTGAGRTGEWFGFQHAGITPDAITLAKGIGGGVPIGALVTFGAASELFQTGHHGSTFGGNPLATATADAVMAEIERADLVGNARRRGEQLGEAILGLESPLVGEVRGRGLLLGIGLTEPVAARIASHALQAGLIVNAPNETSIRLAPPLTIGDAEIGEFLERFRTALHATIRERDEHIARTAAHDDEGAES
ncbi:acetylornithine transaminase [Homoserinibacter sp. YIM 151385]|nr:acetylornithine transaminase [Homoserinibacter sp. YIM 151385]WBU39350.1 acetylornithine transaminase [Homoserinibacter sp. YIM 151385]